MLNWMNLIYLSNNTDRKLRRDQLLPRMEQPVTQTGSNSPWCRSETTVEDRRIASGISTHNKVFRV